MTDVGLLQVAVPVRGVRAVFSTREGGVSAAPYDSLDVGVGSGDDLDAVRANRARLAEAAGFDPRHATSLHQVHGAEVAEVGPADGAAFLGGPAGVAEADALVTRAPGVALMVQGADCVPVLLWRGDGQAVAAAHAGWRGTVAGVVGNAVAALGTRTMCGAAIGPCIGPCCYPVDAGLRSRMRHAFGAGVVVGDAVDLRRAVRRALEQAGLAGDDIIDVDGCTACDPGRFFSYRRDGAATGRQAGVIWREDG